MVRNLKVSLKEKQKENRELIGFSTKNWYVFGKYRIEATTTFLETSTYIVQKRVFHTFFDIYILDKTI